MRWMHLARRWWRNLAASRWDAAGASSRSNELKSERVITVFGSSRPQDGDADYSDARSLGGELARAGFAVCSGGYGGVMEAVSRGVKEAGGKTYGVTAERFKPKAKARIAGDVRIKAWP